MSYPFVHAAADYGPRKGPTRGFVVHMAEGGGTVGFLSRENARGVSVHYVIEYTGRIVQMLREDHVSGSINPNDLRTTEGPDPYGASVGKAVLKAWWGNPNEAVITVEIEGFARDGPNVKQSASLVALVDDVRSRYPDIGLLGHRDFQDYKACPGAHIPWAALGGHGPASEESVGMALQAPLRDMVIDLKAGTDFFWDSALKSRMGSMSSDATVEYRGATIGEASRAVIVGTGIPYSDKQPRLTEVYVADKAGIPRAAPDTAPEPAPTPTTVLAPGIYEVK